MSALFQTIPESFFHPLAAPGKIVYWECIERLFVICSQQLSFGVERDRLVDELSYYFESRMAADLEEDADTSLLAPRDKANFILRRLEQYGWISVDVDHSYVQRVNFRDYAITIIKTLQDVSGGKKTEYQGYIYTIYNLVRARENPGVGLLQIVDNTDALITGLKTLNANIKKYIDELTKHQTVQEIMDALLNDYYTNVVDKAYHRLLTSDNVSKFRPEIVERLEAHARSEHYIATAAAEISEIRELPIEKAREEVLTDLHAVISAFREMDDILQEINRKNTKYQGAAIARAKFLLTSSADIRGQLKNILLGLGQKMEEQHLDPAGIYELEETDRLIRMFSFSFLDKDSLYAPVEGRKIFVPQDIAVSEIDAEERERKKEEMRRHLKNVLSPAKISHYVDACLADRDRMAASEILEDASAGAAGSTEDTQGAQDKQTDLIPETMRFIRIIYIRLYGQRKHMPYTVRPMEEVSVDGYRFRDFEIIRR